MPQGDTTKDENSPPPEGAAVGCWMAETHPEGYAFYPSQEGIFRGGNQCQPVMRLQI